MKHLFTLISIILLSSISVVAQHGFGIEYAGGGQLHTIDLSNAGKTLVGTTMNSFGAADFGPNDVFYAINSGSNELYEIDTTNGNTTLIGAIAPPANHMWTGMAYDENSGLMYGYSAYAIAAGEGSLHVIDVTNATYSTVGTQTTATAIGCIAIDGSGQMYGMNLQAMAMIYQINMNDGSVTPIGNTGQGAAGMGHGMDWSNSEQKMYLTTYNSMTFENTLREVNLVTGGTTQIGGLLGMWTGAFAIPGAAPLSVDFTSDVTDVCVGGSVNFTDLSVSATSWNWTFEGGTPATSTDQNPTVTYNTTGDFDVTLEVGDGTTTLTLSETDYISVTDIPAQPDQPTGETATCGGVEYTYTTNAVAMADTYTWEVTPSDAGTITGTGTDGLFTAADDWSGSYTVKVNAVNSCGTSIWSTELSCTLSMSPTAFFLAGGGSYCEGGSGVELTLDGSETGVDYELFHEGVSTGTIVAGTGSALSFGYYTEEGLYTVDGYNSSCTTLMFGEAYISIDYLPEAGTTPTGSDNVCAGSTEDYSTDPISGANSINWTIDPADAGVIVGTGENIQVEWSESFSGTAYLSVYGTNDCGDGTPSDDLEVTVTEIPVPEVIGESMVCKNHEHIYSTEENTGSTYNWTVIGGDIISASTTTFSITVLWNTVGYGSVHVTEISSGLCEGSSDTLDVFVDDCTNIGENDLRKFNVYPNPAKTSITVDYSFENEKYFDLIIVNQFGQKIYNQRFNNAKNGIDKIDISSFKSGLYFIKVITSSGSVYESKLEVVM